LDIYCQAPACYQRVKNRSGELWHSRWRCESWGSAGSAGARGRGDGQRRLPVGAGGERRVTQLPVSEVNCHELPRLAGVTFATCGNFPLFPLRLLALPSFSSSAPRLGKAPVPSHPVLRRPLPLQ